jgi:alpha-tubulin suppressor-like RCC1 family protein
LHLWEVLRKAVLAGYFVKNYQRKKSLMTKNAWDLIQVMVKSGKTKEVIQSAKIPGGSKWASFAVPIFETPRYTVPKYTAEEFVRDGISEAQVSASDFEQEAARAKKYLGESLTEYLTDKKKELGKKEKKGPTDDRRLIYTFGMNDHGQLGYGDKSAPLPPKSLSIFNGLEIVGIGVGKSHSCVLIKGGDLFSWGSADCGELGNANLKGSILPNRAEALKKYRISAVDCGDGYTVVVSHEGAVIVVGANDVGQLGIGEFSPYSHIPIELDHFHDIPIASVYCGTNSTFACAKSGTFFAWGGNECGQLGLGDQVNRPYPEELKAINGGDMRHFSAGASHCIFADTNGNCWLWGSNSRGQCGFEQTEPACYLTPTKHPLLSRLNVIQGACGDTHSLVIVESRSKFALRNVYSFGNGEEGRLGMNSTEDSRTPLCVEYLRNDSVQLVACGAKHSIAVSSDGKIFTWGDGSMGQLGHAGHFFFNRKVTPKALAVNVSSVSILKATFAHSVFASGKEQ